MRRERARQPIWIGYVGVDDVDAVAERIVSVLAEPCTFRRRMSRTSAAYSVVADPQMAALALLKWHNPGPEQPAALDEAGARWLA